MKKLFSLIDKIKSTPIKIKKTGFFFSMSSSYIGETSSFSGKESYHLFGKHFAVGKKDSTGLVCSNSWFTKKSKEFIAFTLWSWSRGTDCSVVLVYRLGSNVGPGLLEGLASPDREKCCGTFYCQVKGLDFVAVTDLQHLERNQTPWVRLICLF